MGFEPQYGQIHEPQFSCANLLHHPQPYITLYVLGIPKSAACISLKATMASLRLLAVGLHPRRQDSPHLLAVSVYTPPGSGLLIDRHSIG
jgi:hypothetical protein